MSVDIDWKTITSGPDGIALAEKIRDFVHQKFQQVTLPRFINSVHVHSFDLGRACPEIEIKDVCDPLPDFYEDEDEDEDEDESLSAQESPAELATTSTSSAASGGNFDPVKADPALQGRPLPRPQLASLMTRAESAAHGMSLSAREHYGISADPMSGPFPRSTTPGIPGGTSNLSYFHFPAGGLSGAQTPLAAVASGTPFTPRPWSYDFGPGNMHAAQGDRRTGAGKVERSITSRDDPSTRPSTATSISSPRNSDSGLPSPQLGYTSHGQGANGTEDDLDADSPLSPLKLQNRQPSDLQVVARVRYSGDVRMTLTAEILLDYPMPSFVGIPLKLAITGMTFDGVAIVALIKKKMHFCFLDPEDAAALLGEAPVDVRKDKTSKDSFKTTSAGLLQEIHVESEIGRQEDGKQVLKNVGKVEKFVLEQVRKIFEEEFVFPSYWTFLV